VGALEAEVAEEEAEEEVGMGPEAGVAMLGAEV